MKIHSREALCKKAEAELAESIVMIIDKHKLTEGEALQLVNVATSRWVGIVAKYAIRQERHGRTDKQGGFE